MPQTPGHGHVPASKAPDSIWMPVLGKSLLYAVLATIAFFLISWVVAGWLYALSGALAAALVIGFFATGLLVAEGAGRIRRTWAMPAFLAVFVLKVFGIAFVLLYLGLPAWADTQGFVLGAAISLVAWQVGEIRAFSKARMAIYHDS
ncbi:hypothetical protein OK351_14005 [Glutamicibacter sp. MNS18]|uniref:hypothetical protein n=1 Tax=Glutamicibacter sp. MNS18 TaxID=2989817 RepID=UPI002235E73A|nr:hypothetical protein [Glutamicibacter sp. MNS18]MCW4466609.1 hypothetical protein [Glutamicibacter sp. MNS18]